MAEGLFAQFYTHISATKWSDRDQLFLSERDRWTCKLIKNYEWISINVTSLAAQQQILTEELSVYNITNDGVHSGDTHGSEQGMNSNGS